MRFYDFSPERKTEYKRRIKRLKEKNPDTHFPSEAARELICAAMGIRYYRAAINMASELGDTRLCEEIYKENQIHKKVQDVINAKYSPMKETPLMNAVQRKRLGTAEWLLDHCAKILPNKSGWNPVLLACWQGCIPALNMFKYYGVDFTLPFSRLEWKNGLPSKHLDYPIEIALLSNQTKVVEWLFNNGVSVNDKMEKGYSVRQMLAAKPEYFTQEIKEIVMKKMFDESKKSLEEIQKTGKSSQNTCSNKSFKKIFIGLFKSRTKE